MEQTIRLQGEITPEQVQKSPYVYLPFEVPTGATRVNVSYSHSEPATAPFGLGPGNTVDIGIFDSRGHDFITAPGFRGWSGASKREFHIGWREATPGYIPGPLFPGEWNILLGVERIELHGLRYDVEVKLDIGDGTKAPDEEPSPPDDRPTNQPSGPSRWLKGDLHCHTLHSDGLNSVEEIVRNAVEKGLDFLAITDHNTTTHHQELVRLSHLPIILIPGEEVTTYWGHANTWGLREWIEYRCADEESMATVRKYVLRQDALISINHPKSIGPPWRFKGWEGYPCMEVWQAPWRFYNWESLQRWDGLLHRGERVVAVGGSDTHSIPPAPTRHPHGIANPTTWVYAEGGASESTILDGIRKGHVTISDAPDGPQLTLRADEDGDGEYNKLPGDSVTAPEGKRVRFRVDIYGGMDRRLWIVVDGNPIDIIPLDQVESTFTFTLELSGRSYVRAELRGFRGRADRGEVIWAMTNPIFLKTTA